MYHILPQNAYKQQDRGRERLSSSPIYLGCISVQDALHNTIANLSSPDEPAFPDNIPLGQKLSVRIHVATLSSYTMLLLRDD